MFIKEVTIKINIKINNRKLSLFLGKLAFKSNHNNACFIDILQLFSSVGSEIKLTVLCMLHFEEASFTLQDS